MILIMVAYFVLTLPSVKPERILESLRITETKPAGRSSSQFSFKLEHILETPSHIKCLVLVDNLVDADLCTTRHPTILQKYARGELQINDNKYSVLTYPFGNITLNYNLHSPPCRRSRFLKGRFYFHKEIEFCVRLNYIFFPLHLNYGIVTFTC